MSEWKECQLGDLITFQRGHDLPKTKMRSGEYPVVGSNGIIGYHNEYTTDAPSITIGRSGNVGKPFLYNGKSWSHNTTLYIKEYKNVEPIFIYYYLQTLDLGNYAGGSAVPTLNRNHIHTLNVSVPVEIEEQRQIASILSSLDDKIKLNSTINENLEQQAQAIFKSWFVDFEPFGGAMPDDWRLGIASEIIELHDCKRIPLSGSERDKMRKIYPYYGATSRMDYVDNYIFDGIYLLLGEDGTVTDSKGFPILQYVYGKFWVNNHAHIISGKLGYSVESLYLLFKNSIYESYISLLENHGLSSQLLNRLRRLANKIQKSLHSFNEPYIKHEVDLIIPPINILMEKILYDVEKKERYDNIPLIERKSYLLVKEDPFLITDNPRFVFDETLISGNADNIDKHNLSNSNNKMLFSKIVSIDLPPDRKVLAGCMWYPWNHEDGAVFYETAKLRSCWAPVSKDFEWSLGNFGLLCNEGDIIEEFSYSLSSGGKNLFKRVGGVLRFQYGNSQLIPSILWREVLNCSPSDKTPYIWLNENGEEVLWFERIASPMREAMREYYIRQPIIFRWVCDSAWIKQKLQELGLRMIIVSKVEEMIK